MFANKVSMHPIQVPIPNAKIPGIRTRNGATNQPPTKWRNQSHYVLARNYLHKNICKGLNKTV